jgi:hypothetical protein
MINITGAGARIAVYLLRTQEIISFFQGSLRKTQVKTGYYARSTRATFTLKAQNSIENNSTKTHAKYTTTLQPGEFLTENRWLLFIKR